MFEQSGRFISGNAIHYAPSVIVDPSCQSVAPGLVVGERVPPQVFVRAADARPFELQDLLPADTRFKVLVFSGNLAQADDKAHLQTTADRMGAAEGFLNRFGRGEMGNWKTFDVLAFSSATHDMVGYLGEQFSTPGR